MKNEKTLKAPPNPGLHPAMHVVLPEFRSIPALFSHYGINKKKAGDWRICMPVQGQIKGLPNTHGTLLATDGILCLIKTAQSPTPFEGHLEWFELYKPPGYSQPTTSVECIDGKVLSAGAAARRENSIRITNELVNLLLDL